MTNMVGIQSAPAQGLGGLDLPAAPPVLRGTAPPVVRRRPPAIALVVVGVALVLAPIVGGLFSKVAAGKQLIDEFEPRLEIDALARYDSDLGILRAGKAGLDELYAGGAVAPGQYPRIDQYRAAAADIDRRASGLLEQVRASEPDYRRVAGIGGFDRVPFLVVLGGLVASYGGIVLLGGGRARARSGAALVVLAAAAIGLYPFLSDLRPGATAGGRMLDQLAPVMTAGQVRQLQDDFVILVQAVGELDTGFRQVPQSGAPAAAIAGLVDSWPTISSDLADLVGTINDNLDNYSAMQDLDGLPGGFSALPWMLVGLAVASAGLGAAAWPYRRKDPA
jgi:hypothetical protein